MSERTILITGGAGFIGSNLVRFVLRERPGWRVINLDALAYSGVPASLDDLKGEPRHRFVMGDVCDASLVGRLVGECDGVIHLAAESHVDRSIADGRPFVITNVLGTFNVIEAARRNSRRLVFASTDEVYGSLPGDRPDLKFTEESPIRPNNPYAASKAGADHLCRAAFETHGADVIITRCSNNLGPWQFPEKIVPLFVTNLLEGKRVPLYGDGMQVRDWIHVEDHCEALLGVLERGRSGAVYNIGAGIERTNLDLTREILRLLGRPESAIEFVADRPGHDRRYALDTTKIRRELGWSATRSVWPRMLEETVRWYADHESWWKPLKVPP